MSEEAISESELDPSHSEEEYLENEEEEEEEEVDTEDDEDENDGDDEDDSVGEGHLSSFVSYCIHITIKNTIFYLMLVFISLLLV